MREQSVALWLAAFLLLPICVRAADEEAVQALRARALAYEGRCDDARAMLQASGTEPSAAAWLELGRCYLGANDFPAAVPVLEQALVLDPQLGEAYLYLGMAHYHQGDPAGAERALRRAQEAGVDAAQLYLYRGVLQLEDGRDEPAAQDLARARELDADRVEPFASFYEGVALERGRQFREARAAYGRAAAHSGDSPFQSQAQLASQRLGTRGPGRSWFEVSLGGAYDDNVVLEGSGVDFPTNTSDARLVWTAEAGLELLRGPAWRAGVIGYYAGSEQDDLDDFNLQAPGGGLWFDYDFSEAASARLRYDYGYTWLGSDSFVSTNAITALMSRDWTGGTTRLYSQGYSLNYRYPIPTVPDLAGVDEKSVRNRDGNGLLFGADHSLPLGFVDARLIAGYEYERYFARGDDFSSQGHTGRIGAEVLLPLAIELDLETSYSYVPYLDPSSYPNPTSGSLEGANRRDHVLGFHAGLTRELRRGLELALRYSAYDHDSNTDVYDYTRRIVGMYMTWRIER